LSSCSTPPSVQAKRRLEWGHFEADSVVVKGKGGKLRRVPLNRKARAALDSLDRDSENVFHSRHNVARDFRKAVSSAGLETKGEDRVTPHTLRHTALSRMAHKGADVASLQRLAGHSSIVTTQRYLHSKDLRSTVELLDE